MTNFKGTITGATGGFWILSIAGPNHFSFNQSYNTSYNQPLDLAPGDYLVSVSPATPGNFDFDISGYSSISLGKLPDSFNNATHTYVIKV